VAVGGGQGRALEPDRVSGKWRRCQQHQIGQEQVAVPNVRQPRVAGSNRRKSSGLRAGARSLPVAARLGRRPQGVARVHLKLPIRAPFAGVAAVERLVTCGDTSRCSPGSAAVANRIPGCGLSGHPVRYDRCVALSPMGTSGRRVAPGRSLGTVDRRPLGRMPNGKLARTGVDVSMRCQFTAFRRPFRLSVPQLTPLFRTCCRTTHTSTAAALRRPCYTLTRSGSG
jgi:hypothetical protein